MKQVIKMRVLPTEAEALALDTTLRTCNAAAAWLSQQMHASQTFRKFDAHRRFYAELRGRFGLASQPTIRVIAKVADAYASLHTNVAAGTYGPRGSNRRRRVVASPIEFRPLAAQCSDQYRNPWYRTLGRSHASTRSDLPDSQLGRRQQAYRRIQPVRNQRRVPSGESMTT